MAIALARACVHQCRLTVGRLLLGVVALHCARSEAELIAAVDLWAARAQPVKPDVKPSTERRLLSRHITPSVLRGGIVPDPNAAPPPAPPPRPKGPRLEVRLARRRKWKRKHGIFARSKEVDVDQYELPRGLKVVRGARLRGRACVATNRDSSGAIHSRCCHVRRSGRFVWKSARKAQRCIATSR